MTQNQRSHLFYSTSSSSTGAYITHNAAEPLNDITEGDLTDDMQLPLEPQKASCCYIIFLCTHTQ